jgi:hypothetical protein
MQLLEAADVGRVLRLTPAAVRLLARVGRLRVAATTPRGLRLFAPEDVEAMRRGRETADEGVITRSRQN